MDEHEKRNEIHRLERQIIGLREEVNEWMSRYRTQQIDWETAQRIIKPYFQQIITLELRIRQLQNHHSN